MIADLTDPAVKGVPGEVLAPVVLGVVELVVEVDAGCVPGFEVDVEFDAETGAIVDLINTVLKILAVLPLESVIVTITPLSVFTGKL